MFALRSSHVWKHMDRTCPPVVPSEATIQFEICVFNFDLPTELLDQIVSCKRKHYFVTYSVPRRTFQTSLAMSVLKESKESNFQTRGYFLGY